MRQQGAIKANIVPGVLRIDSDYLPIRLALVDHTQNSQDLNGPYFAL